jgi:hypothetical protein
MTLLNLPTEIRRLILGELLWRATPLQLESEELHIVKGTVR